MYVIEINALLLYAKASPSCHTLIIAQMVSIYLIYVLPSSNPVYWLLAMSSKKKLL